MNLSLAYCQVSPNNFILGFFFPHYYYLASEF